MRSGEKLKDLVLLARQVEWHWQLESYSDEAVKSILKALDTGRKELFNELGWRDFRLSAGREGALLEHLNDMTFGMQAKLTGNIADAATVAGEASFGEYGRQLSFDGKVPGFNFVELAPAQLKAMVLNTPIGGHLLNDWVKRSFTSAIADNVDSAILTGYLKGEGIDKITRRLTKSFDIVRREAETLARTYIADANNRAAKAVYDANSDIVTAEEWNATLEVNTVSGRGTCMRCAGLDGKVFPLDKPHPRPPLHARCRCFMTPVTKSYRELGLDIDELEDVARPYTNKKGNKILKGGQFDGNFEEFLKSRGYQYQKDLLGPNRLRMWKDGTVKFDDLVDDWGNIRLLKKGPDGGYMGLET